MFKYTYRNTGLELWQLSMYYMYGSLVGLCNIIFTGSLIALTVSKWNAVDGPYKFWLIFGCMMFTVFQPLLSYRKARKQAAAITEDTEITFDDAGIHIAVGSKKEDVKWSRIKRVSKKPTMIVVFVDTVHGYILSNRLLGKDREAFYQYVISKMEGNGHE